MGGAYKINYYFGFEGEINLPRRASNKFHDDVEVALGLMLTPLHFSIFGMESLEMGMVVWIGVGLENTDVVQSGVKWSMVVAPPSGVGGPCVLR